MGLMRAGCGIVLFGLDSVCCAVAYRENNFRTIGTRDNIRYCKIQDVQASITKLSYNMTVMWSFTSLPRYKKAKNIYIYMLMYVYIYIYIMYIYIYFLSPYVYQKWEKSIDTLYSTRVQYNVRREYKPPITTYSMWVVGGGGYFFLLNIFRIFYVLFIPMPLLRGHPWDCVSFQVGNHLGTDRIFLSHGRGSDSNPRLLDQMRYHWASHLVTGDIWGLTELQIFTDVVIQNSFPLTCVLYYYGYLWYCWFLMRHY
jgi:hypothetical protein